MSVVGLMADPGLPEEIAHSIADDLADYVSENLQPVDGDQGWKVEVAQETLPITSSGMIPLLDRAQRMQDEKNWTYIFYLLDLPQWHDDEPLLSFTTSNPAAALISVPALGARNLRKRILDVLLLLINTMSDQNRDISRRLRQRVKWVESDSEEKWYVLAPGRKNRLRLLFGMVRSNQPGRLVSALSRSLAIAVATGAFGVFYASVWNLADESSPVRLALISLLAMGLFTAWLIINNQLWNGKVTGSGRYRDYRDNLATLFTVGISVLLLYISLFLALFIGAAIVIPPSYLESEINSDTNVLDYVRLTWLAASLGTFAGALGSNFDSDANIESATYSRRVYHRRQLTEDQED